MNIAERAGLVGGGVAAEATLVLLSTVGYLHRQLSHQTLELPEGLSRLAYLMTQPFTDGSNWAFIHRELHHQLPDTDLYPFVEIADRFDFGQSEINAELPEYFDNFDPAARRISLDRVVGIGRLARPLVSGWYEPYEQYTPLQDQAIFDTSTPRHLYTNLGPNGDLRIEPDGPYRLADLAWRLRDPHAPSLHPGGVRGILVSGNNAYHVPERSPRFEEMKPEDLRRTDWQESMHKKHEDLMKIFVGSNVALGALAGILLSRHKPVTGLVQGVLMGGGFATGTAGTLLKGSELVNAMGHAGRYPWQALFSGRLVPNEDGTFSTDGNRLLSWITMDEAGTQGEHHRSPWLNAFTRKRGLDGFTMAPVGRIIERLIAVDLLISNGVGTPEDPSRPDITHESVRAIEMERIRTMQEAA